MNTNNNDTGALVPMVAILAFGTIGALLFTLVVAGANVVNTAVVWLR